MKPSLEKSVLKATVTELGLAAVVKDFMASLLTPFVINRPEKRKTYEAEARSIVNFETYQAAKSAILNQYVAKMIEQAGGVSASDFQQRVIAIRDLDTLLMNLAKPKT